jgi:hypothetical protein
MIELDWCSIGELLSSVVFLLVGVVFLFYDLLGLVLSNLIVNFFEVFLDLQNHFWLNIIFSSFIFDDLLQLRFLFYFLTEQVLSSLVDFTFLLNLDSKQTLLEHIACILNLCGSFWNHLDASIGDTIGVEKSLIEIIRVK